MKKSIILRGQKGEGNDGPIKAKIIFDESEKLFVTSFTGSLRLKKSNEIEKDKWIEIIRLAFTRGWNDRTSVFRGYSNMLLDDVFINIHTSPYNVRISIMLTNGMEIFNIDLEDVTLEEKEVDE